MNHISPLELNNIKKRAEQDAKYVMNPKTAEDRAVNNWVDFASQDRYMLVLAYEELLAEYEVLVREKKRN